MWDSIKNFVTGLIVRPLKEFADGVKAYTIFFGVWAVCLLIVGIVVGLPILIFTKGNFVAAGIATFMLGTLMLSSWLGTLGQNVSVTTLRSKPLNNRVKGE